MSNTTRILVVDDTEPTRYALRRMLEVQGYAVDEARTGAETLLKAEATPDLIILDVRLPDANGYDICRQIKSGPRTSGIPVLHLSATFADSESRSEGLERGADGYLTYPVEPRELVATVEAILRARRAERIARERSELLRVTLASIADGVIATDLVGRITFLNPVAETLTGWRAPEAIGTHVDRVFQVIDEETRRQLPLSEIQAANEDKPIPLLLVAKCAIERPIDKSMSAIQDAEGSRMGTVIVFRDVSERRKAEAELVQSNRHKDEFLAMLAHELRNPLAPIRSSIQVLNLTGTQEPGAVEARAIIERQIEQLVRLVDDLLDVNRITRGVIKLQKEPIDLAVVISRAVESSKPLIDARKHVLEVKLPPGRLAVRGDIVRLAQVLLNLLNNAAKYTPEGGRITLTLERTKDHQAAIRVADTGMGIAPNKLPKIFDLFTQVDRTLDHSEGGLGIGLTLVRRLTELHGGAVDAASPGLGQGSEFIVKLPLIDESELTDVHKKPGQQPRSAQLPGRRILVVDDNRDSADSLAMLLRLFGNDVRTVYDGRQALALMEGYRPALVFLDLELPGMNGLAVARQIRSHDSFQDITLVALTGYGTEEDRIQCKKAGFNAHFVKPIDLTDLQAFLQETAPKH